jgi:hypothetical protein
MRARAEMLTNQLGVLPDERLIQLVEDLRRA